MKSQNLAPLKEHHMDTYFAPFQRTDQGKLKNQISAVSHSQIMNTLLQMVTGLLIILNEDRQIVAINHLFLQELGIDNPEDTLGLRLGESLNCIHAQEEPNGCGTTKSCMSCGAAIAIMTAIEADEMSEKICAISSNKYGTTNTISLRVQAQPIMVEQERFILVSAQDISQQELWANLERAFFHDINNTLNGLLGYSQLVALEFPDNKNIKMLKISAERIHKEISLQRTLSIQKNSKYILTRSNCTIEDIRKELKTIIKNHTAASNKIINESWPQDDLVITTDILLLTRILGNMAINALEASNPGDEISITANSTVGHISWSIWNNQAIPAENQPRIFQKHFSTKPQNGRGFGTYSMKLFGEDYLKGAVSFSSSESEGTTFSITLPR